MAKSKEKAVVICTDKKGVFFGYADYELGKPMKKKTRVTHHVDAKSDIETVDFMVLKRARMCVYWSSDMKGVMGLASQGPSSSCKIGDAVPEIELRGITCVISCTDEAAKKWEDGKWNQ